MAPGAVIVAHSRGCLTALEWLARHSGVAAGAFLVAVPDPEGPDFPATITGFSRPHGHRVEPLLMVGSTDDPYAGWAYTVATSHCAGCVPGGTRLCRPHQHGLGRGPWPEGRALLAGFVAGPPRHGMRRPARVSPRPRRVATHLFPWPPVEFVHKTVTRYTFVSYVTARRIIRAQLMLASTQMPVQKAAAELRSNQVNYFRQGVRGTYRGISR